MNRKHRKFLNSVVACVAIFAAQYADKAHAATAHLVNCRGTSSVTGQFIYVGTYQYSGQHYEYSFRSWCPHTVEIY